MPTIYIGDLPEANLTQAVQNTVTTVAPDRERTPRGSAKVAMMHTLLDKVAEDDLNALFLALFHAAENRGYMFRPDHPERMLDNLNNL